MNGVKFFNQVQAYRPAPRTFQLDLRGYSVASLPRASRFALASRSLRSRAFCASRSQKIFEKKSVSQSTQNALKRVKMQKKKLFTPFDPLRASRVARSLRKFSKKISVSQSTRNTLKRIEMQKKKKKNLSL